MWSRGRGLDTQMSCSVTEMGHRHAHGKWFTETGHFSWHYINVHGKDYLGVFREATFNH
jgi:hypothetical protein